ncbi:MAG: ATP synthase F1 subunit delta [Bacteroidales bacterium]|nr:ATP synthase F1 subunit delta [Bacteroidales bacterium]
MNDSKISVRYAKALFNLAIEKNILDTIKNDVVLLNESCKLLHFNDFLNSPIIPISKKIAVFEGIFKGNVHGYVMDFLILMAKNRREAYLKMITLDFLKHYRDYNGIIEAELTTAVQISEQNKIEIIELLSNLLKGKVEIKNNIKTDIIGGFVLRIDDKQFDASVKTQLKNYRKELKKSVLL